MWRLGVWCASSFFAYNSFTVHHIDQIILMCHYGLILQFYFIIMAHLGFLCEVIICIAGKYCNFFIKTSQVHYCHEKVLWCTSFDHFGRLFYFGKLHSSPKLASFIYLSFYMTSLLILPIIITMQVQVLIFCTYYVHHLDILSMWCTLEIYSSSRDWIPAQPMTKWKGRLIF